MQLLLEILVNMCIVIICLSVCGDINFKINLICLTKLNYYITKKSKIKDLENKESFQIEIKRILVLHPEEIWGQRFNWESALHSSIPAKFYWFSCIRCSFEQNTRKLLAYLRNLSENKNSFLFNSGDFFWGGTYNIWMLPFSVWMQPWIFHLFWRSSTNASKTSFFEYENPSLNNHLKFAWSNEVVNLKFSIVHLHKSATDAGVIPR